MLAESVSADCRVSQVVRQVVRLCLSRLNFCCRQYTSGGVCKSKERIDGKVVIVTGANTGIGKETAKDLVQRGSRILTEFNFNIIDLVLNALMLIGNSTKFCAEQNKEKINSVTTESS